MVARFSKPISLGLKCASVAGTIAAAASLAVLTTADVAHAKGGTAKPTTVSSTATNNVMPPAGPTLFAAPGANVSGFNITGYVQSASVTSCTPDGSGGFVNSNGSVTINGVKITIPTDTIVQFPANTVNWAEFVCGKTLSISLETNTISDLPMEMSVDGNIISGTGAAPTRTYVGALVFVSQQSLNTGSGYISNIDYTTGTLTVTSSNGTTATLKLNDPNGRFGRAMSSPDAHFSVDDENPTIKAAATGYPMCVPRSAPSGTVVETDPDCPQKNRPTVGSAFGCRTFTQAGLPPLPGGDIFTITTAGAFCPAFVMKAISGMPGAAAANAASTSNVVALTGGETAAGIPDPRKQAPFEVGDFITWGGTLVRGATTAQDVVWVHTIDANVGIYTQPATLPAYVAVGEALIGVEPIPTALLPAAAVESTNRVVVEAFTSDVASIVDVYLDDKGFGPQLTPITNVPDLTKPLVPRVGAEWFRWVTTEAMTGTLADQAGGKIPFVTTGQPFGGGIQTQFAGPQAGRARIRANKVPAINPALTGCSALGGSRACAVTQSPTRYIRVALRSLCAPAASGELDSSNVAIGKSNLTEGTSTAAGSWYSINGQRVPLPNSESTAPTAAVSCLESAPYANGLMTGQYLAPVGEFIYPEPTLAGSVIPANNFYQMGFLVYGEGGNDANAQQVPRPW